MPTTASQLLDRNALPKAKLRDPFNSSRYVRTIAHPVLINGDDAQTVYELNDILSRYWCGYKRGLSRHWSVQQRVDEPFESPTTEKVIRLSSPGSLVAVRWSDSESDTKKAERTENQIERTRLVPAEAYDPHYLELIVQPDATLAEWVDALTHAWFHHQLSEKRPYMLPPVEALRKATVSDRVKEEASVRLLEWNVATEPGEAPQLLKTYIDACKRRLCKCVFKAVRAALLDQDDLDAALRVFGESSLALDRTVDLLRCWQAMSDKGMQHTVAVTDALNAHRKRHFYVLVSLFEATRMSDARPRPKSNKDELMAWAEGYPDLVWDRRAPYELNPATHKNLAFGN